MKNLGSILVLSLLIACSSSKKLAEAEVENDVSKIAASAATKTTYADNINYGITEADIEASMTVLASDDLKGRATGTEGIEKAAQYIESFFQENGIKPYFETYRDYFEIKLNTSNISNGSDDIINGFNVVGYIEGTDPELKDELVILGGHYDHIGVVKSSIEGDSIANGANDDASGTIAAMEFGKYFAKSKSNKRSVLITLYAAEEMGLKGSSHLAKRLKTYGTNVYTMINFEMIGVPRIPGVVMAYMTGFEKSNFAEILNNYAGDEVVGYLEKAKSFNLFKRSDNFPFYRELNIPAHAISTFDFTNFEYYHHVDDEPDQMDYTHMASFINKMIPALEGMINASTKEINLYNE